MHGRRQRRHGESRRIFSGDRKKVMRREDRVECELPLVYLVDSAGVFLPMQDEIFPDEDDFGRIFRNNAVISATGSRNSPRSWATASPAAPICRCCATSC